MSWLSNGRHHARRHGHSFGFGDSCLPFGDLPLARLTELAELAGYLIGIAYMLYVAVPLIQAPQST